MAAQALLWAALAFVTWIVLIAVVSRLGVPEPVVVAAALSWIVARLIIWGVPAMPHWLERFFVA